MKRILIVVVVLAAGYFLVTRAESKRDFDGDVELSEEAVEEAGGLEGISMDCKIQFKMSCGGAYYAPGQLRRCVESATEISPECRRELFPEG